MNYWLIKSDPEDYGWEHLVKDKKTNWTGVRNFAARSHLKQMKAGDLVLFYHSQKTQAIVGISKVTKEFFKDPTSDDDTWGAVEIQAVKSFKQPVTLKEVKADKDLQTFQLVRISRLSVMPVTETEFQKILEMGETRI
jgi:predicted RNA-binding protein with PUA-like domain